MDPLLAGLAAFLAIFGGALFGIMVARWLPPSQLGADTRVAVSVSMAVLGTLSALVLSLLINEANTSFSLRANAVYGLAANIERLDRSLRSYGSDADSARAELRSYARQKADEVSANTTDQASAPSLASLEGLTEDLMQLKPADEPQRLRRDQALQIAGLITDERWALAEKQGVAMPAPFLILLNCWLALLFASFCLFAPRNWTVIICQSFCALAIAGGIYMIVELGDPTTGILRTPAGPLVATARSMVP